MLGMGEIVGPNEYGIYVWKTRGFEETQATIALLWGQLGPLKRAQASAALKETLDLYRSGRLKARASRRRRNDHIAHAATSVATASADDRERAGAAGFMDAEGCFGLARSMKRKNGPQWYKIRVSASQHGNVGVPAQVLTRLHAAFDGLGRIERLGAVKVTQATTALKAFRPQVRLKGDATHCVRGHAYSGVALRGGRLRRICRECNLIYKFRRRASKSGPQHKLTKPPHRYTP